jgi:hypothetical protein
MRRQAPGQITVRKIGWKARKLRKEGKGERDCINKAYAHVVGCGPYRYDLTDISPPGRTEAESSLVHTVQTCVVGMLEFMHCAKGNARFR